jgi:hypothetical protein
MGFFSNLFGTKYKSHPEAVIVSCFFNAMNSPHRLEAFRTYYESIKHLNHRIIECSIDGAEPQLTDIVKSEYLLETQAKDLLWHKEALLNRVVKSLPSQFRYIFWLDADVLFTNRSWLTESVEQFKAGARILQPFNYAFHLERGEKSPTVPVESLKVVLAHYRKMQDGAKITELAKKSRMWQSFASVYRANPASRGSDNYDVHGHVGLAWGAIREVFDNVGLYDKALIGGADHVMAHAAVGQIDFPCITRSFIEQKNEIATWSRKFHGWTRSKISYVEGDLYHLWHGDLEKREYFSRIRTFTPRVAAAQKRGHVTQNVATGLYETDDTSVLDTVNNYMMFREIESIDNSVFTSAADPNAVAVDDGSQSFFPGFGGGSFGGAGATTDYSDQNTPPAQDFGSTFS